MLPLSQASCQNTIDPASSRQGSNAVCGYCRSSDTDQSKLIQAEADRLRARLAAREESRQGTKAGGTKPQSEDELGRLKALSDRFLSQSHAENARDTELRRAQRLVAKTIAIARAKYPDDPTKTSKEVEASRIEVAIRIANG